MQQMKMVKKLNKKITMTNIIFNEFYMWNLLIFADLQKNH